ncbi:NAD(P)-dependent oxidoreductase [Bartonella sp. HY038]|uniref:NAD-dependent epimerase/dehydratase family protein n=1 Tax=Bartonella sp. HY038 TaxID=2759660 RepID=UPI0015F78FF0|nr:NAD(P)-dependent oxidoreductase [Bartonella sp. HY038]
MRVIVTGATGFLGLETCRLLRDKKCDVIAIGRNLKRGELLTQLGCTFWRFNLENLQDMQELHQRLQNETIDGLVHAAALSSLWGRREDFYRANVEVTENLLKIAQSCAISRFIFISSPSIYFTWADQLDLDEYSPLPKPINNYAASKVKAERLTLSYADLSPIILRPRAIYGAGDTALLPRLIKAAQRRPLPLLRNGVAVTNLTHVEDVARAIWASLLAPRQLPQNIFNIAGKEALPITKIVNEAAKRLDCNVRWKKTPLAVARPLIYMMEQFHRSFLPNIEPLLTSYSLGVFAYSQTLSIKRAQQILGFEPQIDFAEGLDKTFHHNGGLQ